MLKINLSVFFFFVPSVMPRFFPCFQRKNIQDHQEGTTDTQLAKQHLESRDHLHPEYSVFEFLFAWILKRCRGIWKMGNAEEKAFLVHGC